MFAQAHTLFFEEPLTLHLLSYNSSTPAMISITRAFATSQLHHSVRSGKRSSFELSVAELESAVEGASKITEDGHT
jgi:hypothetical protein